LAPLVIGDLGGATTLLEPLGFTITTTTTGATDPATGRGYLMAVSETGERDERRWGCTSSTSPRRSGCASPSRTPGSTSAANCWRCGSGGQYPNRCCADVGTTPIVPTSRLC
jgi:hypothetical protein